MKGRGVKGSMETGEEVGTDLYPEGRVQSHQSHLVGRRPMSPASPVTVQEVKFVLSVDSYMQTVLK